MQGKNSSEQIFNDNNEVEQFALFRDWQNIQREMLI